MTTARKPQCRPPTRLLRRTAANPKASPGNLCVYVTKEENLDETTPLMTENNLRLGFGLVAKAKLAGSYFGYGQWAVTAP